MAGNITGRVSMSDIFRSDEFRKADPATKHLMILAQHDPSAKRALERKQAAEDQRRAQEEYRKAQEAANRPKPDMGFVPHDPTPITILPAEPQPPVGGLNPNYDPRREIIHPVLKPADTKPKQLPTFYPEKRHLNPNEVVTLPFTREDEILTLPGEEPVMMIPENDPEFQRRTTQKSGGLIGAIGKFIRPGNPHRNDVSIQPVPDIRESGLITNPEVILPDLSPAQIDAFRRKYCR